MTEITDGVVASAAIVSAVASMVSAAAAIVGAKKSSAVKKDIQATTQKVEDIRLELKNQIAARNFSPTFTNNIINQAPDRVLSTTPEEP